MSSHQARVDLRRAAGICETGLCRLWKPPEQLLQVAEERKHLALEGLA